MDRKLPSWAKWAATGWNRHIDDWEHDDVIYYVVHTPGDPFPWSLNYVYLKHQGGGGAPFKTRSELDDHVRRYGLRPVEREQQLTLGI